MFEEIYEKYGLENEFELISGIQPKGYNVESSVVDINDIKKYPDKTQVTVYGYVDDYSNKTFGSRKNLMRISCKLYRDGQSVTCAWVVSTLKYKQVLYSLSEQTKNQQLVQVTGKIASFQGPSGSRFVQLDQPKFVSVSSSGDSATASDMIVPEPMYRLKSGMTPFKIKNAFRSIIKNLEKIRSKSNEFLPLDLESKLELQPLELSLKYMHGFNSVPSNKFEDFLNYPGFIKRINAEKIWSIIQNAYYDSNESKTTQEEPTEDDISFVKELKGVLPFELTEDQNKTIWNLLNVFVKTNGSKSLVFGDVGSGKTMVAMFLAYIMYKRGYQVAIMTPTSILSKQHFEEFESLLNGADVFLVHSKTKVREKNKVNKHLREGKPAIVVGTTSVNSLEFTNLGSIFIDEEQKLGVHAKEKLVKQFDNKPHTVYMTATPIPRTLASSIYTNFHVFQIKTKPKNRLGRLTSIMDGKTPDRDAISLAAEKIKNNEQALVIIPSIDSNELANVKGTVTKYSLLFPDAKIESIHGKMDKKEVDKTIERYMEGEFDILVSTTMVDSGFSNSMLSFVFVENADRFGIAQLHQIRGRCGRGKLQGYCFLIPTPGKKLKDHTFARLSFLCKSEDGFKLSEFDLNTRGSGDLKGTIQSGTELNLIDWANEIEIMKDYLKNKDMKQAG